MRHHRAHRIALTAIFAAAAAALVTAAGAGGAAPRTTWSRISGPTQPGVQLGLARRRRRRPPRDLEPWRHADLDLRDAAFAERQGGRDVDCRHGLRRQWRTGPPRDAGQDAPPVRGRRDASQLERVRDQHLHRACRRGSVEARPGLYWGGAFAGSAAEIGASLAKDGTPVTAWRGFAGEGLPPR